MTESKIKSGVLDLSCSETLRKSPEVDLQVSPFVLIFSALIFEIQVFTSSKIVQRISRFELRLILQTSPGLKTQDEWMAAIFDVPVYNEIVYIFES